MTQQNTFKRLFAALAALAVCGAFSGCTKSEESGSSKTDSETSLAAGMTDNATALSAQAISNVTLDDEDTDTTYDDTATVISLSGDTAAVSGSGATVDGSVVTITEKGTYVLRGSLDDGQILVNTDQKVHLVLEDASVTCKTSAALQVLAAKKVVLTLAPDTTNRLSDGDSYTTFTDEAETEPNAALFSKSDLTINGTGSLRVEGNCANGIQSKDTLCLVDGVIDVTAVGHGIKGKDAVIVKGGSITVNAGGDGIKASNTTDTTRGYISVSGGKLDITAAQDGMQAETCLAVSGGETYVLSGGGTENAPAHTDKGFGGMGGFGGGFRPDRGGNSSSDTDSAAQQSATPADGLTAAPLAAGEKTDTATDSGNGDAATTAETTPSTKGIKAGTELLVTGGTIAVDTADDALHANNAVEISGGMLSLAAGGDGVHADSSLTVSGGEVTISQSYEGLEAAHITIAGGKTYLTASDDGINASDGSSNDGGMNGTGNANCLLTISDGFLSVNADGDGLDSNGEIRMTGGTVLVSGPTNSGNGALDCGSEIFVDGGVLLAAGSAGMAEAPSEDSKQHAAHIGLDSQQGGTMVAITDADGKLLAAFVPEKQYSDLVFSAPQLQDGQTYTVSVGGSCDGTATDGYYTTGTCTGGTEALTFTVSSMLTTAGNATSGMQGGFGGGHGNRPGGGQMPDGEMPSMPDDFQGKFPDDMPEDFQGKFPGNFSGGAPTDSGAET